MDTEQDVFWYTERPVSPDRQTVPMRPLSAGNGWNDCRDYSVISWRMFTILLTLPKSGRLAWGQYKCTSEEWSKLFHEGLAIAWLFPPENRHPWRVF